MIISIARVTVMVIVIVIVIVIVMVILIVAPALGSTLFHVSTGGIWIKLS